MSFRRAPQSSEDGFTLVEVLLAVSLVAMMATLVFGSLYVTTSAIDAARANSANEQIVRSTLRVMIDELSVGVGPETGPWMGINGQQGGQPADSIAFLTMGQFRGVGLDQRYRDGSYRLHQRRGSPSSIRAQESLRADRRIR